jgi:hypothetical protein
VLTGTVGVGVAEDVEDGRKEEKEELGMGVGDDDGGGVDVGLGELEDDEDIAPPSHLPKIDRHPAPQ